MPKAAQRRPVRFATGTLLDKTGEAPSEVTVAMREDEITPHDLSTVARFIKKWDEEQCDPNATEVPDYKAVAQELLGKVLGA